MGVILCFRLILGFFSPDFKLTMVFPSITKFQLRNIMEFVRTTDEPCSIYRCCGEEFDVDPSTEENLFFNGERLLPQCPKCDEINTIRNTDHKPSFFLRVFSFPLWLTLLLFHFSMCVFLTIFVHPERKRYKHYEYYSPWGWGERKDCPYEARTME